MTRKKNGKYIEQIEHVNGHVYKTVYNQKTKEVVIIREVK